MPRKPPRIDAHQHFWAYSQKDYEWIDASMGRIARDFGPDELLAALRSRDLDGCVAVQARTVESENDSLLALAERHPFILGVVGWTDLTAPDLDDRLGKAAAHPRLVGFREILQGQPREKFINQAFIRGLRSLTERGFSYDVLVYSNQLDDAGELIRAAPEDARLVLDHLGKPDIRGFGLAPWATRIRALGRDHPNLHCKFSGLVTEAGPDWVQGDFKPYLDLALEAFGPSRLLYGSDWPVCLLNGPDYGSVYDLVAGWAASLGAEALEGLFGGNAERFYRLRRGPVEDE